jgi:hypothetical protein
MAMGLLMGVLGSYILRNNFALLTLMMLGITGTLIGAARNRFLNWNKPNESNSRRVRKQVPPMTSEWNYRPRETIERSTAGDSAPAATAETLNLSPSSVNETNIV